MKKLVNYIGQLRLYSLADLILMLYVIPGSHFRESLGAVLLWVGFLAHLESVHKDRGREPVNKIYAWLFWLQAFVFLGDSEVGTLYILLSIFYSFKKKWYWARLSPLIRGLQTISMLVLVSPSELKWYWLFAAAILVTNRNFWGDARDTVHDAKERVRTWPVAMGMKNHPFAHLFSTIATTLGFWLYANTLRFKWLALIVFIEVATYWLTPRQSNKKAAQELRKILQYIRG